MKGYSVKLNHKVKVKKLSDGDSFYVIVGIF